MENSTILYSILYTDQKAYDLIPELINAWNLTPHRISKFGEQVSLPINNKDGYIIKVNSSTNWVKTEVNNDNILFDFSENTTTALRQDRIFINIMNGDDLVKILTFVIHQNG